MVVDDVEDDGDPQSMGTVDEAAKIRRSAVEPGWCEEVDAVISPAERPGKSATGMISRQVIPSSARAGSSRAAAAQVPPGVKVPTCIS
jgi:hypothetical protein